MVPRLGYTGVALTEPISWVVMTLVLFVGVILALKKNQKAVAIVNT